VAEIVADAFLLHQPADEVEVGFAVLHAVGPLAIGAGQLQLEVGESVIREHRLDDVGDGQLLEDAAVGGAGQEPQPRTNGRDILPIPAVHAALSEPRHVAVEVSGVVLGQPELDRDVLPENVVERNVVPGAEQIEVVLEEPAHLLARAHRMEQQDVLAERRDDLHHSGHVIPRR
jgi:hypothetical protein